jgi:oxygen-independent coproporphyrinogen-3 oxidase
LQRAYFQRKFDTDILERFAQPLARLRKQGHLTIEGDCVVLGRESLLMVDQLLHEFFLPEHQNARYT